VAKAQTFSVSIKEEERAEAWKEEHSKTCNKWCPPRGGMAEGWLEGFSHKFTRDNCAEVKIEIECACGAKEDVTDYDSF